jgi:hypothetical protein
MVATVRVKQAIAVIGLLACAAAAHAASVTNRDERDHRVTIIEGEAKADHVLKPSQTLSDVCLKGCTIRMNRSEDDDYLLSGGDAVSIEDGTVFYDMPDTSAVPASPPAPKKRPARKG